ncbi:MULTISPECIES: respiratory chain complex I subunit 1 family protein [Hafnia]|uniref:Hydrogenase 3 membrane subunit n=2 Tax=Hafnia TaxID=568 RepID=A0A4Q9EW67_9GAMM|nr:MULTISPECIES: respiratory chain complex I subunit 1 family protein [Hafnia]AJR02204.1 Formate hydrogenlyase subunit 4 [Enterobacteriaceae bacterium bta3-1]EHM43896.1 NADH dehydrogenase [Hafnia alvei ATCC 51873]OFS11508.1 hydrogenase 3 membrane subunit [Hafnia sp. HMSC23F03]QQE42082.1 respiratory chain complex I subunit 1 family protein [Hafnia alvei]TBM32942.1 hydrogenase 3 membrane subunit [Hafnia paralvei]
MSSLSILVLALIQALVLLALAPLFSGISRVLRAKIHSRKGPDIFQDYRDIFKLFKRQNISPAASGVFFQMMPYVMVGTMLTIATALPVVTVISPLAPIGDLITVVYLFAVARFFFAIAGLDTGSTFTGIGASRESMLGILVEPILMLGLWVTALLAGSTNLGVMSFHVLEWDVNSSLALVLALLACAFATFIEMGKLPFDMAEAEQELQEGPLTEYSGSAFAVLKLGISLKQLVVLQLFIGVFVPWGQMTTFSAGALVLAIVAAIIKLLVGIALIALFENSVARLRFLKTSYTTWAGFGLAAAAFLSWLIA